MTRLHGPTFIRGVIVLAMLSPFAALASDLKTIRIGISYSDAAIEQLGLSSEQVIVSATYSAPPAAGSKSETNEIGMVNLGSDQAQILPSQNEVTLPVNGLVRLDPATIGGPIEININVFSARQSSDDNILNCDFFEGSLDTLRRTGTDLHCFLIKEGMETKFKS